MIRTFPETVLFPTIAMGNVPDGVVPELAAAPPCTVIVKVIAAHAGLGVQLIDENEMVAALGKPNAENVTRLMLVPVPPLTTSDTEEVVLVPDTVLKMVVDVGLLEIL